jgi:hypothetical protein
VSNWWYVSNGERKGLVSPWVRKCALLLLTLFFLSAGLLVVASSVLPNEIAHKLSWRFQIYAMKATGGIPELSWGEVIRGTWPGSGFITDPAVRDGRSLEATVRNPLNDPDNIAEGRDLFLAKCAPCHGKDGKGTPVS